MRNWLFSLLIAAVAAPVCGQIPSVEWDRAAGDALKEIHDRGVDLYNAGDSMGAYRLYQGALLAVRPLLTHRPAAQKLIDAGLADSAKSTGMAKSQAYRLHTAIEAVRAELKKDLPRPTLTMRETAPPPRNGWARPTDGPVARGRVTLDGKPLGGVEVSFVSADRVDYPYTGTTSEDGSYFIAKSVPVGDYAMSFHSPDKQAIPSKYNSAIGSGLKVTVSPGENKFDFDLKSK